ncbi:MAG: adenylate/guanylate cyclase domain-containing protein [Deltaproteobacteria bacterium]
MPSEKKTTRKLRAILSADVKGYSLLMANDEAFTIKTLKKYRGIMSEEIKGHSGRVVDAPGDNLLAEFSSAVDAVECAVGIQKHLKKENETLEEEKKLQYRIGVNIGDVVQDGDRIYGSGVNVAARIEGLAEPGGICISRNVYDQIKDKVNFGYEYLGDHEVKNIKDPVRVYKVLTEPEDAGKLIGKAAKPVTKNWIWATVVLVVIVLTGIITLYYQKITEPDIEPASVQEMAYPLPEKPSIAVLPFDNLSGDPGQNYLADGITENIITALSNIPEMFVIARNSVYTYKGKPTKTQKVAKDLGIRYVLEGSIQKEDNRIRITGQLIDAITGHHLWAEKYDRKLDDLFAIQDEITLQIVSSLQVNLTDGEQARLRRKSTKSLKAWELAVRGYSYWHRYTKEDNAKARELFQRAIDEDPKYAWAWTMLGFTYFIDNRYDWNMSGEESFKKMVEFAHKSVLLDGSNPDVHALLAQIQLSQRNYEMAIKEGEKSLLLGPNSAENHAIAGMIYRFAGKFEDSIRMTEKAIRLHPYYPDWYLYSLEYSYYYLGEYEKAINYAKKHIKLIEDQGGTDTSWQHLILAQNYIRLGQDKEARYHAIEALKKNPEYTFKWERETSLYKDPALIEQQIEDLRKAGLTCEGE